MLHLRVSIAVEWVVELFIRIGSSQERSIFGKGRDLKGIFGMKAFAREDKTDCQAGRQTRIKLDRRRCYKAKINKLKYF